VALLVKARGRRIEMAAQGATAMQHVKTTAVAKSAEPSDIYERMHQLYDTIEKRAFEIFDNNGRWFGRDLSDWLQAESELLHPVHLEIVETDNALTVRAEVPGFTPKELDIQVEPRRITISGKHETKEESKKGKTIYSERCAKEILRSIELPAEIDSSKVNATLKNGILNIELPKSAGAKTIRVEAKTAS
jgi:HSP20 family molecular chaperone IbpA